MEKVQDLKEYCLNCKHNIPEKFSKEEITLEAARTKCGNCKLGKQGIFKFDIVFTLWQQLQKEKNSGSAAAATERPKGKKETYTRRYGQAITKLQAEGKTIREIASILGISPTSVTKVVKKLKENG